MWNKISHPQLGWWMKAIDRKKCSFDDDSCDSIIEKNYDEESIDFLSSCLPLPVSFPSDVRLTVVSLYHHHSVSLSGIFPLYLVNVK
jgi:hypothetical protein